MPSFIEPFLRVGLCHFPFRGSHVERPGKQGGLLKKRLELATSNSVLVVDSGVRTRAIEPVFDDPNKCTN